MTRPPGIRAVCFAALAVAASPAHAEDPRCGGGSFHENVDVDVRPGIGASGVALDAPVVVRYLTEVDLDALEASLAPGDALVSLLRDPEVEGEPREVVDGRVDRLDGRTLAFVPVRRLARETEYYPLVAKPGFDVPALAEFRFESGDAVDSEPPDFPLTGDGITVSSEALPEACDGPEGGLRVGVAFPPATDDGDEGSIEYFLYLTRGFDVDGPELRGRTRDDGGGLRMSLLLTEEQAHETACIAIRAVDGVGRAAKDEPELCFDPIEGSYFRPCAVADGAGAARGGRAGVAFLVACALALAVRARSRRGTH